MDTKYLEPFVKAVAHCFETMVGTSDLRAGPAECNRPASYPCDISGIIGLSGGACGSVALNFTNEAASSVISKMINAPVKQTDPELSDGIGELVNIIAGNAKAHPILQPFNLSISLPNMILGPGHIIVSPKRAEPIIVPFSSSIGNFILEVWFEIN